MSREEYYKVYQDDKLLLSEENVSCYSRMNNHRDEKYGFESNVWTHMLVLYQNDMDIKIKGIDKSKEVKEWYLNRIFTIDPRIELIDHEGDKWFKVPNYGSVKTLFILSIIRYLWDHDFGARDILKEYYKIYNDLKSEYDDLQILHIACMLAFNKDCEAISGHSHLGDPAISRLLNIEDFHKIDQKFFRASHITGDNKKFWTIGFKNYKDVINWLKNKKII